MVDTTHETISFPDIPSARPILKKMFSLKNLAYLVNAKCKKSLLVGMKTFNTFLLIKVLTENLSLVLDYNKISAIDALIEGNILSFLRNNIKCTPQFHPRCFTYKQYPHRF